MKKIQITTKANEYPYYYGNGIAEAASKKIARALKTTTHFLLVDEKVFALHRGLLQGISALFGKQLGYALVPSGEKSKSFTMLQDVLTEMLHAGCDRKTMLIAVGGGVCGDLAGFAASIFKRGLPVIHVPTTLLSMIDSSVGGKTGINFSGYKNIIGTFYQPAAVIADTQFLTTLPERELNSGLGEAVKYAFLGDKRSFHSINQLLKMRFEEVEQKLHDKLLNTVIGNCVAIKAKVVEQDELETGLRKILNLGHTFAHAIETVAKYKVFHGEAVAAGMIMAISLGVRLGFYTKETEAQFLQSALLIPRPALIKKLPAKALIEAMRHDKKNTGNEIRLVLIKEVGELFIDIPCTDEVLEEVILTYQRF